MFGFGKKPRAEVGKVGGFGKVPALGDFVRTPGASDEMVAFEAWLTRALEAGEARAGSALKAAWKAAAPHAFLWSGAIDKKLRGVFAGVMVTSNDSVGRRFPLVIGAPLPAATLAPQPHAAPLLLHAFFHQAAAVAERARRTMNASEFQAQVVAIDPPSFDDPAASVDRYTAWAKAQRPSDHWSALYGEDAADEASRHALGILVDATSHYRGQDMPPLTLGVRVPLGAVGKNALALWIDLVRAAAGWKTTVPSFFFPLNTTSPEALIQLGAEAPPSVLADLYARTKDSDSVCELGTADGAPPPPSVSDDVKAAESLADVVAELAG